MVLGPADVPPEEGSDDQLVDQVGHLPLGQQKWDKLPANAEKKLDKFFFPKVECTATAVLCCCLTAVPAV